MSRHSFIALGSIFLLAPPGIQPCLAADEPVPVKNVPGTDSSTAESSFLELSAEQGEKLAALIQRDVKAAEDGGVRAFRDTFFGRLNENDQKSAGLDLLSVEQIADLNEKVARLIANAGQSTDPLVAQRFKPKAAASTESFAVPKLPLEVHGSVTAVYGTSRAGDFYGGGASTTVFDPNKGWSATIAISTLQGNVPYSPFYSGRSGYGRSYGPYDGLGPLDW